MLHNSCEWRYNRIPQRRCPEPRPESCAELVEGPVEELVEGSLKDFSKRLLAISM